MNVSALRKLIANGESGSVEFKKKANHPEKIVREIVAFANSNGGHLFIGVDDNGTIAGLKYPEEDTYVMNEAINKLIKPEVKYMVELVEFGDQSILHYQIEEGDNKPYFAFLKETHRYGKAFIRVNDRSIQASRELRRFLKERKTFEKAISFEKTTTELFKYFEKNSYITLTKFRELSGLNKKLASNKLVSLALSGALKIEPREGEDFFLPVS